MRKFALFLLIAVTAQPALAQDFNYTPGWSNTQNFNRLHRQGGDRGQGRAQRLEPCRFDMLPRRDQRRLQQNAQARIAKFGEKAAMPWINRQSENAIAQMVRNGVCRSR